MRSSFPLFQSHLDLAHTYWSHIIQVGDCVIDATCGNGRDTLKLSQLALSHEKGIVYSFDIQEEAIRSTTIYLNTQFNGDFNLDSKGANEINHHINQNSPLRKRIILEQRCHSTFPDEISRESVKLIVYNLGYLPGGNKEKTTVLKTTLQSLKQAEELLIPGGAISVTCYPGHEEGEREFEAILDYGKGLPPKEWSCCQHSWINREKAPCLLLFQKAKRVRGEDEG